MILIEMSCAAGFVAWLAIELLCEAARGTR